MAHPDIGLHPRVARDGAILCLLPLAQRRGRARDDALVEGEMDGGDGEAGEDQRRDDLMGRNAGCLHADHLAMLVERGERDERAEQHREGQEARNQLGNAQRDVAPQLGVAIAFDAQDLAGFAEQVEHLEDDHQSGEHRQRPQHEDFRHVEGDPPRREELDVDHPGATACNGRRRLTRLPTHLAAFAAPRSSGAIGWPPGL